MIKKTKIFTKNNNKIELIKIPSLEKNTKTILFIGVTHGDEPQGEFLINNFLKEIENISHSNNLLFIPCLNPDGKALNIRTTANGVDINRNFPTKNWELTEKNEFFGGEHPSSEIETQFLTEVIEKYKPDVILSIHAPFGTVNFDGPAKELAKKISELTSYPIQEDIGYPTPGSFGTFAGIERNIPTITLELPENVSLEKLWKENKEVFYYLMNY